MEDLFLMDKKYVVLFCILFFCLGTGAGMFIVLNQDFSYKDASIMTCEYANKLTNLVNDQTRSLELCVKDANYTKLDLLNCGRLK